MPNYFTTGYGNNPILIENWIRCNRVSIQLWYRMNESRGKSGKIFQTISDRSADEYAKGQMRDEGGGSEVYDVRKEKSAMGACLHYPRRGVNKYMHKRKIDVRLGEIGWGRGKF
jgi:hypothetical protein